MFLSLTSGLKMPHDTANNHWMIFDRGCSQWARIQQEGLVGVVCGGPGTGVCRLVLVSAPQLALHRAVSSSWTGAANLAPTITTTTAHTPCTVHKHPVLYTLYTTHPVLYTLQTKHPVLYTLYTKHPVLYAVYSVLDIVYTKQTAIYPILYNVYNKLNTLYVHTGLGRQDILSLDTGHHGKTDNLGTFAAEVTWHIFAMCPITEPPLCGR